MADSVTNLNLPTVVASVCVVYALWIVVTYINHELHSDLRKIPGPFLARLTDWPARVATIRGRRSVWIYELHGVYGPYVRITPNEVAVADIEGWRQIHRVGSNYNKSSWYQGQFPSQLTDETSAIFGVIDNKFASRKRRLFLTAGSRKVVAEWEPKVIQLTDLTIKKIKADLGTDAKSNVMKWWTLMATDVMADVAFGESWGNVQHGKKSQLTHDIEAALPFMGLRKTLPWISMIIDMIPLALLGEYAPPWKTLRQYGKMAVENTRKAIEGDTKTLFSKMVPEGELKFAISDLTIENEAGNALIAGTDTTAMTLTYLTFEVLKNSTIHRRLVEEIHAASSRPAWNELERMSLLNNVINETMRLHPSVPASLPRTVPPGGDVIGGYAFPEGTTVSVQAWGTFHHDPTVFPDPWTFNPDRWISPTPAMKEYFMPFGGPSRLCVGQNLARLELLHAVYRFFRELPNVKLAEWTTDESMRMVDYFTILPKAHKCDIVVA